MINGPWLQNSIMAKRGLAKAVVERPQLRASMTAAQGPTPRLSPRGSGAGFVRRSSERYGAPAP
jgi:hypothetical protein